MHAARPPRVGFTRMEDGSAEDFTLIARLDREAAQGLSARVLAHLALLAEDDGAYQVSRLEHALQTATRAERDGASDEWIAAALLHDIGDVLAPDNHGAIAAEILRPYASEEVVWAVHHHGLFQRFYNASLPTAARAARDAFRDHRHYAATVRFCARWDQVSFDPKYESFDLAHFEPLLRRVLSEPGRR